MFGLVATSRNRLPAWCHPHICVGNEGMDRIGGNSFTLFSSNNYTLEALHFRIVQTEIVMKVCLLNF